MSNSSGAQVFANLASVLRYVMQLARENVTKMGRLDRSHSEIFEKVVPEYPKPVLAFC